MVSDASRFFARLVRPGSPVVRCHSPGVDSDRVDRLIVALFKCLPQE